MGNNQGKAFEEKFRECWKKSLPEDDNFIYRLPDQVSGFLNTSQNPCDFICFTNNRLFLIECKSHDGASIPFTSIPQYERLLNHKNKKNVFPGIVIWFKEKDKVLWVPIETAEKIYNDGNKSIQLKMFVNKLYNIIEVPSVKKRVFMDSDYSIFRDFEKEEN